MSYDRNIRNIVANLIPSFIRDLYSWFLDYMYALFKSIQDVNDNLQAYWVQVQNKLKYTAQVIQMERYLNDLYDNTLRRIFIENTSSQNFIYLYNLIEARTPVYLYNLWDSGTSYSINEYSSYGNMVYKALTNNLNKQPDTNPTDWEFQRQTTYLWNLSESGSEYDYIVWVPSSIVYEELKLTAEINVYNFSDKTFTIKTF